MRASFPHPVVWVVIGLPLATLVAGFTTLGLIGRGGLDTDSDPVRRTAQVQQVDLSADEAAMRADASALLQVQDGRAYIALDGLSPGGTLVLALEHPLDAARDVRLVLEPAGQGWAAAWPESAVAWHVELSPEAGGWRLVGRWAANRQAGELPLSPALAGG